MSLQPPKIDNRSYDDIVEQTVKLVQDYTTHDKLVDNKPDVLRDRTLAEDIKDADGKLIASTGTLIDEKIANEIAKIAGLTQVNVKVSWRKTEKPDAGLALIRIFGRMAALVSDRLNQVPEKNFLAFLDLIGTQILPPQPARVPLTFSLASGVPENTVALVPAYTQIAAPPSEGEEEEVVFETENDLIVTPVQLQAVFVRQPNADEYSEWVSKDEPLPVFLGVCESAYYLYIACEELFTLPFPKEIGLKINLFRMTNKNALKDIPWSYEDGDKWQQIPVNSSTLTDDLWEVSIPNMPYLAQQNRNQINAVWLRADFTNFIKSKSSIEFRQFLASASNIKSNDLALKLCFFNTIPIDINKDFYPFGEQPRFNDAFYIALDEAFAKPKAQVKVKVTLSPTSPVPVNPSPDLEIDWEVWDGMNWESVKNQTKSFTQNEEIIFSLPDKVSKITVNGKNAYWVRTRIVKGNYGTEFASQFTSFAILVKTLENRTKIRVNSVRGFIINDSLWIGSGSDREEATIINIDFSTNTITLNNPFKKERPEGTIVSLRSTSVFGPPSIQSLTLSYTYNSGDTPISACQTYNNFKYVDRTNEANQNQPWSPFTPTEDKDLALYLGFNKPFPNRAIALYFQVEPPKPEEVASTANLSDSKPVRLVWEYSNGSGWTRLGVVDETKAFTERGLIRFIGPSDFQARSEFGRSLYWLRVRKESGEFRVQPRLRRILTNTIWAVQAITLNNEVLGSSDGNPNQTFWTTQTPVLEGQKLEVQEGKEPPPEEKAILATLEGKDAIAIVQDEVGQIEAVWVRWHQVTDFYESGMRDRHYIMNHLTGEIQFGDGQHGMIPPQGRNNICMARYRTDGGEQGNKPANTITQLKTTIPYIDSVINLEAAGGGADRESIERVKERGPKFLRHRGRAVTVQDFEDLAYEAFPDVARVKAIAPDQVLGNNTTTAFNPLDPELWLDSNDPQELKKHNQYKDQHKVTDVDWVKLFIVPQDASAKPIPSLALIERVETYLRDRASPTINLWVGSPQWLEVSVTAEVVPTSLEVANQVRIAVIQRLETFLHPLTGGVSGQGWEFGREPHYSDFYALIEAIDGIDYVRSLTIPELQLPPKLFLVCSAGNHKIDLFLSDTGV